LKKCSFSFDSQNNLKALLGQGKGTIHVSEPGLAVLDSRKLVGKNREDDIESG
jgi:hypothetical protein